MLAFLLPLLGFGKSLVSAIGGWLSRRSLSEILCIILGCALLLVLSRAHHWKSVATERTAQIVKCTSARHADQAAYTKAQADAQAKNAADVARDKAERERITNAVSQSYEAELASVRADLARRLRQPPVKGAPGQPGLPGVSQAPSGVDGGARLSIPTDLYVRGAELEVQLEQLQRWVEQQSQVKPGK